MKDQEQIISAASETLKRIMKEKKISVHKLKKMINEAGFYISAPTMYKYVENPHSMRYRDIIIVASVLGLPIEVMNTILLGHEIE